jgi:hypothetical protein
VRRRAVAATLVVLAIGALIGALWGSIAPPIHAVVAITHSGERVHDYLGNDSQHFFDAPCLMLGLLTVLAVVAAVVAWQRRARRGPAMVIRLVVAMAAAAGAAAAVGVLVVRRIYGALDFDAVPLVGRPSVAYVLQGPPVFFSVQPLTAALTVIWPVGIAALVYAVLVVWHAHDHLGARIAEVAREVSEWPAVNPAPSDYPAHDPG